MPPIATFQFKRTATEAEGRFTGLASTFGPEPDRGGEVVARGAFKRTIERLSREGARLPLLWNHDAAEPIGYIETLAETDVGLEVTGRLMMEMRNAKVAYDLMTNQAAYMSIGYKLLDGEQRDDGVRILRDLDLAEISVVTTPMNPAARVMSVKSQILESPVAFEKAAREALGLSAREAKRLSRGGWQALAKADDTQDDAALATLAQRLHTITKSMRATP